MHVPLDEHLHTEECNQIIRQLKKCHEETSMVRVAYCFATQEYTLAF